MRRPLRVVRTSRSRRKPGAVDHLDVELGEADAGGGADAIDPAADDMERVFGGIEQDATRACDREAAQAADARGDGDGQINQGPEKIYSILARRRIPTAASDHSPSTSQRCCSGRSA